MHTAPVRLLLADQQTLFRSGLEQLFGADARLAVVGQAEDYEGAVRQCDRLRPDVVLIERGMPWSWGLDATRRIVAFDSDSKVIILTAYGNDSDVAAAFQAGASGYIQKDADVEALIRSILAVHLGAQVVTGRCGIERRPFRRSPRGCTATATLTPSEHSILRLVASGVVNRDIALDLGISEKTVRNHMSHIYEKLQVRDRSGALLYAMRAGMVNL